MEGGVIPTLAHKFFETGLTIWALHLQGHKALMVGVETPLMDKIILWNQGLIEKEYLNPETGKMDGKHANECILPSALGLTKTIMSWLQGLGQ